MVKATPDTVKTVNNDVAAEPGSELTTRLYGEHELRSVGSLAEAVDLYRSIHGDEIDSAEQVLGDGFERNFDKRRLVGVPLFVMEWKFSESEDYQSEFVIARVVAEKNGRTVKAVITDGSTGICKQLKSYTDRTGKTAGLLVRNGLRASEYTYRDGNGKEIPATTYYFDIAAE